MDEITYYKELFKIQEKQIANLKEINSLLNQSIKTLKQQIELYKVLNN